MSEASQNHRSRHIRRDVAEYATAMLGGRTKTTSALRLLLAASISASSICCQTKEEKPQPTARSAPPGALTTSEEQNDRQSGRVLEGPVFEDPDFKLEVHAPKLCASTGPFVPKPGFRRLSIPLSIEARSSRVVPISPVSFRVEDKDGHRYGATLAGCSPTFPNDTLTAGETRRGEVAFDVPQDAGALELVYEPFLIGRKRVLARVDVPNLAAGASEQAGED